MIYKNKLFLSINVNKYCKIAINAYDIFNCDEVLVDYYLNGKSNQKL